MCDAMSCVYATSCVFACVHVAFEPFCSYKQQSPDFYQLATMAILCTESGKELVTWEVVLTPHQGNEKTPFVGWKILEMHVLWTSVLAASIGLWSGAKSTSTFSSRLTTMRQTGKETFK